MRPAPDAIVAEIVGIALRAYDPLVRSLHAIGVALSFGIGHRLFLGVEADPHLAAGIAGTRPTHQGIEFAPRFRLEFQHPLLRPGAAGLHGRLARLIDARPHVPRFPLRFSSLGDMVGATGFEPATSCSQSRHSTGLSYAPDRCNRRENKAIASRLQGDGASPTTLSRSAARNGRSVGARPWLARQGASWLMGWLAWQDDSEVWRSMSASGSAKPKRPASSGRSPPSSAAPTGSLMPS